MPIEIMNLREDKPKYRYDFYADRRTPVGNPFFMSSEKYRDEVCDKYEEYFNENVHCRAEDFKDYLLKILKALRKCGKVRLFCWCAPKRCHVETIKRFLEEEL